MQKSLKKGFCTFNRFFLIFDKTTSESHEGTKDEMREIITVDIKDINFADEKYRVTYHIRSPRLYEAIKTVGLLNPPLLQKKGDESYRIITGFRRCTVLKDLGHAQCAASLVEQGTDDLRLFDMAIRDNLSVREFNAVEISRIINKLEDDFHVPQQTVIDHYLPLLGYGRNPRVIELFRPLILFDTDWQKAISEDKISLDVCSALAQRSEDEKKAFFHVLTTLKLGKNRQREFCTLLDDIARKDRISVTDVIGLEALQQILHDEKLTFSQKTDRFKQQLWKMRFPTYETVNRQFEELLSQAKLPPEVSLRPAPYFEGENFTVSFTFKNETEYGQKLHILTLLKDDGIIEKITTLVWIRKITYQLFRLIEF
jgi:ParB family chromosome partitioning protein